MPHKCLDCKNIIESGTIDIQKGCPICGGKKFQYIRPRPAEAKPVAKPTVAEYVEAAALREPQVEAKESPVSLFPERKPRETPVSRPVPELTQARNPELAGLKRPGLQPGPKPETRLAKRSPADRLGERVESVRIVELGTYDINLPLLLSRKEFVTAREEGNYTVDLKNALKLPKKNKKKRK